MSQIEEQGDPVIEPEASQAWLFHLIGFFSTIGIGMLILLVIPDMLSGKTENIRHLLEEYRGIEPFLVFVLPVILIGSFVWVSKVLAIWRWRKNMNVKRSAEGDKTLS